MEKQKDYFKIPELFGITQECANELVNSLLHIKLDYNNWLDIMEKWGIPKSEATYKAFVFGQVMLREGEGYADGENTPKNP